MKFSAGDLISFRGGGGNLLLVVGSARKHSKNWYLIFCLTGKFGGAAELTQDYAEELFESVHPTKKGTKK